jgi:hypothetical protein
MNKNHDLNCAVNIHDCHHTVASINRCVVCDRTLQGIFHVHLDTCSTQCFNHLLKLQRDRRDNASSD